MVLTLHHLGISQGERIIFLCEELGIPYDLVLHDRAPVLSPESLKSVPGNYTGKSPFIEDSETGITLAESGAICEYIMSKAAASGNPKRLDKKYGEPGYTNYVYWFHYANAGLQASMVTNMFLGLSAIPADNTTRAWAKQRLDVAFSHINERLASNQWLGGEDFTAADVMTVYSLSTQRYYGPLASFQEYPHIVRYLADVGKREAYVRAMEKGDPHMKLVLGADPPENSIIATRGIESPIWKK